jgi:glycerol kinase
VRKILLALDQGTSSSRALLFDQDARLLGSHGINFSCSYPQPGWVEVDGETLWQTLLDCVRGVLRDTGISAAEVHALGITNQRETVIAWNRTTGEPVRPAIVWQCRRTAGDCDRLRATGIEDAVRERTGLLLDAYFSATKMRWMLDQRPEVRRLGETGELCFGTVDSWIVWKLTGGQTHLTDASNASRTLLYNLSMGDWDPWLLDAFGIPRASLPAVVNSSGIVAHTDAELLGAAIPIAGIAGDQQAALFGQCCFTPGMAKNTYGTGCFLLANSGAERVRSRHGLLSTVAWRIDGQDTFALEGSVFVAGALIQWLRDELGLVSNADDTAALADSVPDSAGVIIVPAFVGLGAPHWDSHARGLICGLTRGSTRAHIARAALEAVAFQNYDLLEAMQRDTGVPLRELRIDGGMSSNDFLCQFQADLLGIPVSRPLQAESTAFGAALLAGLGSGVWGSLEEIARLWGLARRFEPRDLGERREALLQGWRQALARARL